MKEELKGFSFKDILFKVTEIQTYVLYEQYLRLTYYVRFKQRKTREKVPEFLSDEKYFKLILD